MTKEWLPFCKNTNHSREQLLWSDPGFEITIPVCNLTLKQTSKIVIAVTAFTHASIMTENAVCDTMATIFLSIACPILSAVK